MFKVVDLFAGPGGLGEGFSSFADEQGDRKFEIVLSIEKEDYAFRTLKLRSFFHHSWPHIPEEYYQYLRGEIGIETLYASYPVAAKAAAKRSMKAAIGADRQTIMHIRNEINDRLQRADNSVLIGGPPCQAYSLVGRSRNAGNPKYDPEKDIRQKLYVEYLQILSDHKPAVFIMENVKGLLSATFKEQGIFGRMLDDLRNPAEALEREGRDAFAGYHHKYSIYSLISGELFDDNSPYTAVVKSELYGIPQSRHRVILLGIRSDLNVQNPGSLALQDEIPISKVIGGLPKLRSRYSQSADSDEKWLKLLRNQEERSWMKSITDRPGDNKLRNFMISQLRSIRLPAAGTGSNFIEGQYPTAYLNDWYCDARLKGICNHTARSHMRRDLYRYFYAACYAKVNKKSPTLRDFPNELKPKHKSAKKSAKVKNSFTDRFRVQLLTKPATTIMSHISKDGHYYIHPDPKQCRSLTVREAARVQTFPDNYFFEGSRTEQYIQIGNAVPPYLAYQIAEIVYGILSKAYSYDSENHQEPTSRITSG